MISNIFASISAQLFVTNELTPAIVSLIDEVSVRMSNALLTSDLHTFHGIITTVLVRLDKEITNLPIEEQAAIMANVPLTPNIFDDFFVNPNTTGRAHYLCWLERCLVQLQQYNATNQVIIPFDDIDTQGALETKDGQGITTTVNIQDPTPLIRTIRQTFLAALQLTERAIELQNIHTGANQDLAIDIAIDEATGNRCVITHAARRLITVIHNVVDGVNGEHIPEIADRQDHTAVNPAPLIPNITQQEAPAVQPQPHGGKLYSYMGLVGQSARAMIYTYFAK